ncbi:MAG TPA: NUDIX hydrolase [Wenzhouxiangella sp.]
MAKSSARTLYEGRYLLLQERDDWEFVARHHPVAAIIAWTPANELLLVEQYRKPIAKKTIEIPAGLIGDVAGTETESMLEAAGRELEEETGWRAGQLFEGISVPTSAGLSSEWVKFVWAKELVQVGPGGGDASEDIIVHAVAKDQIDDWLAIKYRDGYAIDPKIYAALYWSQANQTTQ